jgi:hypothetical protein
VNYNYEAVKKAIEDLLFAIGEDPKRDGLLETPDRVARAYRELLSGMNEEPSSALDKQFEASHDGMVVVKDIVFSSLCEHHMLPFAGVVNICYIPSNGKITGLSKFARVVEGYSHRLQVQERLTGQIADAIEEKLNPKGVLVVIQAEHMCMSIRGVKKNDSKTITSVARGCFKTDFHSRIQAMSLMSLESKGWNNYEQL